MLPIKSLKIALPLATSTTATFVTASLVTFGKEVLSKDKKNEDKLFENIELKAEEFKEETINYQEEPKEQGEAEEPKSKDSHKEEKKKEKEIGPLTIQETQEFLKNVVDNVVEVMKHTEGAKESDKVDIKLPEKISSEGQLANQGLKGEDEEGSMVSKSAPESSSDISLVEEAKSVLDEHSVAEIVGNENQAGNTNELQAGGDFEETSCSMETGALTEREEQTNDLSEMDGVEEVALPSSEAREESVNGQNNESSPDISQPSQKVESDVNSSEITKEQLKKLEDLSTEMLDKLNSLSRFI